MPLFTSLAVPGVITAAVVKVTKAAVPGEGVHDPSRAYSMEERSLSVCCEHNQQLYKSFALEVCTDFEILMCYIVKLQVTVRKSNLTLKITMWV